MLSVNFKIGYNTPKLISKAQNGSGKDLFIKQLDLDTSKINIGVVLAFCKTYNEGRRVFIYYDGEVERGKAGYSLTDYGMLGNQYDFCNAFYTEPYRSLFVVVQYEANKSYNAFCGRVRPYLLRALASNGLQLGKNSKWLQPDERKDGRLSYAFDQKVDLFEHHND